MPIQSNDGEVDDEHTVSDLKSFYCAALKKSKEKFAKTFIVITNVLMFELWKKKSFIQQLPEMDSLKYFYCTDSTKIKGKINPN